MKNRILSGIQPSGNLHIGNYLGAIKQWISLQDEYESLFCIVDLHAITVPQDPETLRARTIEIAKIYLAAGIDPKKSTLFVQSHVHEHAELGWILNCITKNGDLTKMTQFKDKALSNVDDIDWDIENASDVIDSVFEKNDAQLLKELDSIESKRGAIRAISDYIREEISRRFSLYKRNFNEAGTGLFDYPVLMAADILLYDTVVVPVGDDQTQHVELARTLARRFNKRFGETFVIPEAKIQKEGARIMALDNPVKKMSKSAESEYNYIALMDDPETARKKIMKAVTDSGSEIVYAEEKPALKNLINIYSLLGDVATEKIVEQYRGKGYADFKRDLGNVVATFLTTFQERYRAISDDEARSILHEGAKKARELASKKMREVKEKVGFMV